ncbi:non-ribosomal peptide synthetase [Lysobacter enzymogenes]|uniref:non-ribosomal peptide synthetase n=1 Tax=Lysobacter enzymogenes TaxID=69 RepID=UPI001A979F07|nr:non-ribosomal peptide synthetase [Lysobacter enzymogenes]QQP96997.1 amino acid adenylation domain-containing protein [Lysobacter enzymogenes]
MEDLYRGDASASPVESPAFAPLLREVLGAHAVARAGYDSFVQLGGDSLAAMTLAARAQREHGLELSLVDLLGSAPLAAAFAAARVVPAAQAAPAARADADDAAVPLGQEAMWVSELALDGPPHHLVFVAAIDGAVDTEAMSLAVDALVRRHEALRTVLRHTSAGLRAEPLPGHRGSLRLLRAELEEDSEAAALERAHTLGRELAAARFDHEREPALRLALARFSPRRHALLLCAHHLLLDGWAIGLLLRELFARYDAALRGDPALQGDERPAPTLQALLHWQRGEREAGRDRRQAGFWRERLRDVPALVELACARPRPPIQNSAGERWRFDLGAGLSERVRALAAAAGTTEFALLLSGFAVALKRHTGLSRFPIGVPAPNRPTPELQNLIGLCNNIVPVVLEIDEDRDAGMHARSVQAALAAALAHAGLPYAQILQAAGAGGEAAFNPYVQVVFSMHDRLIPNRLSAGGARVAVEDGFGGRAAFDLTVFVERADPSFAGEIEFASAIYDAAAVANLFESWRAALESLTAAPQRALEETRAISATQRALLTRLNDTARPYRDIAIEAAFAQQARATPDAAAVEDGALLRSYRQLERDSALQAARLRAAGVGEGDHVLLRLERSYAEIVALLGVLRCGAAYVALESDPAPARLQAMCEALRPRAILAVDGDAVAAQVAAPRVQPWSERWDGEAEPAAEAGLAGGERVAYVAFTSGTTGTPRGVRVPHRGVMRLIERPGYCEAGPGQRMLRFAPLAFDASTFEAFAPLVAGGCIVVHPPGLPTPQQLGAFLSERAVTAAWLTAGLFRLVADFAADRLGSLRWLLAGGDVVPAAQSRRVLRLNPGLRLVNGYGPTENSTFTTVHCLDDADAVADPLPIGVPLANTTVCVLDERDRELPPGAIGELHTGGAGLALDYLRDPAHTAARFGRFCRDLPERLYRTGDLARIGADGVVYFHGRRDGQVKIRGHRVELEDLRRAILELAGVRDAAVCAQTGDSGDKRLLAAVLPAAGAAADAGFVEGLRTQLKLSLPGYMQPARWVVLETLPVTRNGKVDWRAIEAQAPAPAAAGARAPEADARAPERRGWRAELAQIFAEVLELERAEDSDDFFDLGGDSLRAARLLARIRETWEAQISLREFYPTPTLAHLTELLARRMEVAA